MELVSVTGFSTRESVGELRDRVSFVRGYLCALQEVSPTPRPNVAEKFHELATLCKGTLPIIKERSDSRANKDEKSVRAFFQVMNNLIDRLRELFDFIEQHKDIFKIDLQDRISVEQTIEFFEEARETLALGLSPEFRKQISEARQEAELDELQA